MAVTIDLVKQHPELYKGRARWERVTVPSRPVIAVEGQGDPNTSAEYADALQALYGSAYTAKFLRKKAGADDFKVAPLEGLWWADDMSVFAKVSDKRRWRWLMFIPVPEFFDEALLQSARVEVTRKHPEVPYDRVRLIELDEGDCVQYLWVGPYDREHEVLLPLHDRGLAEMGLTENGHHHEIYLNDPRRTAPEKLKTLLRQPVAERGHASRVSG